MMQKFGILGGTFGALIGGLASGCAVEVLEQSEGDSGFVQQQEQSLDDSDATVVNEAGGPVVRIISRQSGKCLDVSGGGSANGTNIHLWTCNGTNAQNFEVQDLGGGNVRYVNVGSNKCVDVSAASTANGANIHLWECNGTSAQSFYRTDRGDGFYSVTNSNSGKSLDVAEWGTADGSNVQQWGFSSGYNQMWRFETAPSTDPVPTDPVPTGPITVRVMSLNVWGHNTMPGAAGAYADKIKSQNVDVVGIQEGVHDWQIGTAMPTDYSRAQALGAALGNCYQRRYQVFVNVCRGNSIVRNDRFDLTDGPNATRTGEAVTITKGGKTYGFIDVHWDHQSASVNLANARETAARAQGFGNIPVVVLGDFNTSCTGSHAGEMKSRASLSLDAKASIDCIFSRGTTRRNGYFISGAPSDHPAVVAELSL